jgi:adenosyl cobinamide kinase/adenosyl cobinamide phosphate guanylyltransferase
MEVFTEWQNRSPSHRHQREIAWEPITEPKIERSLKTAKDKYNTW